MPIMAAQERNDARSAARILASSAKACLDNPATAPANTVVLNNVFRLLESYRVNPFFELEPVFDNRHFDDISLTSALEVHVSAVHDALQGAVAAAFAGQSKNAAVLEIEATLKGLAYPELGAPTNDARSRAANFFSEVSSRL